MMDTLLIILVSSACVLSLITLILCIIIAAKTANNRASESKTEEELSKMRSELNERFDSVQTKMYKTLSDGLNAGSQAELNKLGVFGEQVQSMSRGIDGRLGEMRTAQDEKLEAIRVTLERNITQIRQDNQTKLDEIKGTVEEKLQKTLEERVTESFKLVGTQLEQVHKSLGEMQTLANGVGDLKKILSNVKNRGIFGEVQLSRILEQILTTDQYATNIATKKGSRDVVEFAVRLPGKGEGDSPVYLPLDSKFPLDVYTSLLDAYDSGNGDLALQAGKTLEAAIKKNAKDIHDKYIDPPNTTDFAVMFLPTESLYAEVVRRTELVETVARTYSVNITGPSTVSAFLNSLQMGFRTLAIEKRSHEVWTVLGAVKTEFATFSNALDSVKKRVETADSELEKLIGTRTKAVMRKLREVEALPEEQAKAVLDTGSGDDDDLS